MEKENNKNNGLIADYEERKQKAEAFTELHFEKFERAVSNLHDALDDEYKQKDTDFLKVLLNDVILQAFSYFEDVIRKDTLSDDSILLHLAK